MAPPRTAAVLIVEDDADILSLVSVLLKGEGYEVLGARDAESGLTLAREHKPDLILLDIALPGMDGLELVGILRRETRVPIILLTARTSPEEKVVGFKLGCDDYVTKPFAPAELRARVRAMLNRASGRTEPSWGGATALGSLSIDLERHDVRVQDRTVALAPREFELLRALLEASGKIVSRETLLRRVWGYDDAGDLSTRTVDQHVVRLRRKLRAEGKRIITMRRLGYRLNTD